MDKYLKPNSAYERLWAEYTKYGSLIVAVDYDDTLFDFHGTGESYEMVQQLVRDLHSIGCKIIIWSGSENINDMDIYNPRRASWDNSWVHGFENPQFYQQVNWELNALEKADFIILNLLPNSKSPISLLELGLFAKSGKLLVCCPKEFYRSGNIQIVCDKYNIPLFTDIDELLNTIKL